MSANAIEIVARWIEEGGPGVNLESTRKLMAGTVRSLATHAGAAAAEPVAWRYRIKGGEWDYEEMPFFAGGSPGPNEEHQALYTTPLAALTSAPAVPEAMLMQDENSGRDGRRYNEWHASRPDARLNAREAAALKGVQPGERGEG